MKIIKASCAGACYGVQRALDLARKAGDEFGSAQTLGPLIHNPQVVSRLESAGVTVAATIDDIDSDTVVIRTHGVTPDVHAQIESAASNVIDATCPHVLRAQRAARKLAHDNASVIVIGEESHPEVKGICAWASLEDACVIVVNDASELPEELKGPVGVVVQTTQPQSKLDDVIENLKARGITPKVENTICDATLSRQEAAAQLAAQVDAMVVIGGHNSSNTTRLFEICNDIAAMAFHVETADELDRKVLGGLKVIGVTAGASTPDDMIDECISTIESWGV